MIIDKNILKEIEDRVIEAESRTDLTQAEHDRAYLYTLLFQVIINGVESILYSGDFLKPHNSTKR